MASIFERDLAIGKVAEKIVWDCLGNMVADYVTLEDVSDKPEYYYFGDIAVRLPDGSTLYIEVKNDKYIHKTHKVLCEEKVIRHTSGTEGIGDMDKNHTIMAVVSEPEHRIYFLKSAVLRGNYKAAGSLREIHHPEENSTVVAYLLPLDVIKKFKGLLAVVDY